MNVIKESILSKIGQLDYVKDGVLHRGANTPSVMVTAEGDLAELPKDYPPGTIAQTAGFKQMWQLAADGTWVSLL